MGSKVEKFTKLFMIESYFNTINHILNGTVALYMTWLCFNTGWASITWHVYLTTIGYQLLMAEGIMTLNKVNSWTYFHSRSTKRMLHWFLQGFGTILVLIGNVIIIATKKSEHFKSAHAITGLISMIFLILSVAQGIAAYYAYDLRHLMKPIQNKFGHTMLATICFIVGMLSLTFAYFDEWMIHNSTNEIRFWLIVFALISTFFTLFGAIKNMINQVKSNV